jgi:cell wall-associated NlpC family hydrolase
MRWMITALALGFAVALPAQADDSGNPPFSTAAKTSVTEQYLARARDLVLHAMGFLGVRYKYGGDSPEAGFDCSGLVNYVFSQALGLVLPRDTQSISHSGEAITRDELQPGDLVFFNTLRRPFSHVGIYLGDQRFIHAPSRGGQVEIVSMRDRYWQQRYNGARRISL